MAKLVLHRPDGSTRDIPLVRERTTIGRRPDNDICLPLPTVSGAHAAVVTVFDDSFLEDLGSHNGTLVNGKEIRKHFLRDHDEIHIGEQRLVYVSGESDHMQPEQSAAARDEPVVVRTVRTRGRMTPAVPPGGPGASPAMPARNGGSADGSDNAMIDTSLLFVPSERAVDSAGAAYAEAPALEVLDGPRAGTVVPVDGDELVVGRLGLQLAAVRRTSGGFRLVALEGETPPSINGVAMPGDGALLAVGDEIGIAGTRLRYRSRE